MMEIRMMKMLIWLTKVKSRSTMIRLRSRNISPQITK